MPLLSTNKMTWPNAVRDIAIIVCGTVLVRWYLDSGVEIDTDTLVTLLEFAAAFAGIKYIQGRRVQSKG